MGLAETACARVQRDRERVENCMIKVPEKNLSRIL